MLRIKLRLSATITLPSLQPARAQMNSLQGIEKLTEDMAGKKTQAASQLPWKGLLPNLHLHILCLVSVRKCHSIMFQSTGPGAMLRTALAAHPPM